jgi:uncharacterized protein YbjT (DUF2867 family)
VVGTVLVTGGTGTLGRAVVRRLGEDGRDVRVLSRRGRVAGAPNEVGWVTGDLRTGAGLAEAVRGVDAVVHCASDTGQPDHDITGTDRLLDAAAAARVPHLAYISIVGVDRVPLGYYRAKLTVERHIEESGLPWTILRTTQFHDLVLSMLRRLARWPVLPLPAGLSFQPVHVEEVANRLVGISDGVPAGRVPDLGGPQVRSVVDLARAYLRAAGRRRLLLPVPVPGRVAAGYRAGGHLTPDHADGKRTFEEFLAQRFGGGSIR